MDELNKIYILGHSGSGTSFLAEKVSKKLDISAYDMDDVRFIKKFTNVRTKPQRKKLVNKIIKKKRWIIDARGTDWDRHAMLEADLVVWLKTPPYKRVLRIFKRYFRRKGNKEMEEKFLDQFSLAKYSLSYPFSKRATGLKPVREFLEKNELNPTIIRNNRQLNKFLENLK